MVAVSPRAKTSDTVAVDGVAGNGWGAVDEVEEGGMEVSCTRRRSSTTMAPVLGCFSIIQSVAEGSLGAGEDVMVAEAEGKPCVFLTSRWTKGFIMLPVLQTHMPTPISPSSVVRV